MLKFMGQGRHTLRSISDPVYPLLFLRQFCKAAGRTKTQPVGLGWPSTTQRSVSGSYSWTLICDCGSLMNEGRTPPTLSSTAAAWRLRSTLDCSYSMNSRLGPATDFHRIWSYRRMGQIETLYSIDRSINQSIDLFVQKCNKHWTGHQGRM